MTTSDIAKRWVELVKADDDQRAMEELYSEEIESVENNSQMGTIEVWNGIEGKKDKNKMWYEMVKEVHEIVVSDPVVAERAFACSISMDVTYNNDEWGRQKMSELAVIEVKDGKIIREEYIY